MAILRDDDGYAIQPPVTVTGGFKFDSADELRAIRDRMKASRDKVVDKRATSERLRQVEAPGLDHASSAQAVTYNEHGAIYLGNYQNIIDFMSGYIVEFSKVIGDYVATEDANNVSVKSQGEGI
jgi:hypothetical protein